MQEFIIFCGLPGSGKSTYAKQLKTERGFFVVSSDTIRFALNAGIYPHGDQDGDYAVLEPVVWALAQQAVVMLLQAGHSVAIDATNLTKAERLHWKEVARSVKHNMHIKIVWCTGKYDSPERWARERGSTKEEYWRVRQRLEAKVEAPTADEADVLVEYARQQAAPVRESDVRTICLDFDGVLNTYTGWVNERELFEPREGVEAFLQTLRSRYDRVVIYSTRQVDRVWQWLSQHRLACYIDCVTQVKPRAEAYIDDRGICFRGDYAAVLREL